MRTTILAFAVLATAVCGCTTHGNKSILTKREYLETLDSAAVMKSLVYQTADTAYSVNPELLLLLDTLYQHEFTWTATTCEADVKKDEAWVATYRKRLCAYYDRRIAHNDTISEYAKADSVLNEGFRLTNIDNHYSAMETNVTSDIEYRFNYCREYGQLSQLVNVSEDTTKNLLYKEFICYVRMSSVAEEIVSDVVKLHYWGGTIAGPLSMTCLLSMQETRMESYQNMIDLVLGVGGCRVGVFPSAAKKLYEDCVSTSMENFIDFEQEYELPHSNPELYVERKNETVERLQSILPLIDDWLHTVAQLDNALTHDGSRHHIECNAATILTTFAEQTTWY